LKSSFDWRLSFSAIVFRITGPLPNSGSKIAPGYNQPVNPKNLPPVRFIIGLKSIDFPGIRFAFHEWIFGSSVDFFALHWWIKCDSASAHVSALMGRLSDRGGY
jgi:hypothetical protein